MKLVYNDTSHSYWLNGRRVKSASKVAQIASDSFAIEQWQKRQIAIGMTLDKTLAETVAVDLDNRDAIQEVCDKAHQAAKADARANRGTQRHRVFDLLLTGQTHALITDQQRADAEVLQRTLDRYGLEPIPDRVEQFVAWPEFGVVGRYDAVLMHEGRPVLTDLKGGANAVKYPHSTVVQLGLYAFAPHTSKAIARNGDKSTVEEWWPMPDGLDQEIGYVIYCDDNHEVGELWQLDLVHGRKGVDLALAVVGWRKAHDYGKDIAQQVVAPVPLTVEPDSTGGVAPHGTPPVEERPAPRLDRLEQGALLDKAEFDPLNTQFKTLEDTSRAWLSALLNDADKAHLKIAGNYHVRSHDLAAGLLTLANNGLDDNELVRMIVATVLADDAPFAEFIRPGIVVGALDAEQAQRFAVLCTAIAERPEVAVDGLRPNPHLTIIK